MHPPYFENATDTSVGVPLPKGRANCQVNEIMHLEGQTFRNPIGRGWSKVPIRHPITCETVLGIIEIVGLADPQTCPLPEDLRIQPPQGKAAPNTAAADT